MARAGRKRKTDAAREPSGKVQRVYVNPKQQVAQQPHRLQVVKQYREWPEAETHFGRLMLQGKISVSQYEAGNQYAELAGRYRSAIHSPSINPCAVDLGRVGKGRGEGMPDHSAKSIALRYDKAFVACGDAGYRAQRAVKDYAVLDQAVPDAETLKLLIAGLTKLVSHFGIDRNLQITERPK